MSPFFIYFSLSLLLLLCGKQKTMKFCWWTTWKWEEEKKTKLNQTRARVIEMKTFSESTSRSLFLFNFEWKRVAKTKNETTQKRFYSTTVRLWFQLFRLLFCSAVFVHTRMNIKFSRSLHLPSIAFKMKHCVRRKAIPTITEIET